MQEDNKDPFSNLRTVDWSFLEECSSRTKCIKCNKSRKYYCYSCCIALPHIQDKLPKVKLPLKVDIIKHPKELDGKSTAPHASILAPDDVTIHTFPCIPDYNCEKVIIVFPGEDSVNLEDLSRAEADSKALSKSSEHLTVLEYNDNNEKREVDLPVNTLCDSNIKDDYVEDNAILSNITGVSHVDSHSSEEKGRDCDTTCNKEQCSDLKNTNVHISNSDSHTSLKRKRIQSEGGENGKSGSLDDGHGGKDLNVSNVKHQKTRLRECPFEKVVFVDCTWNQTKQIVNDERLNGLKKVELKSEFTHFWRSQVGMPKTYLSTIEAIYFFFKDFHSIFVDPLYRHEYDNLLMFFCFMYHKIKQSETVDSV